MRHAVAGRADSLEIVREWRRKQLEYLLISNSLQQGRVSFSVITRRALDNTLSRVQMELTDATREDLVQAWNALQLWPDAEPVLTALDTRGYRIGLLSNGDEATLRALATRLPIRCDDIFSSDTRSITSHIPACTPRPCGRSGCRLISCSTSPDR